MDLCGYESCGLAVKARGLCGKHYAAAINDGSLPRVRNEQQRHCSVESCVNRTQAKSLCPKHYRRIRRYGDTSYVAPNGRWVITSEQERFWKHVEKTDGCWLWTGAKSPKGYGRFKGKDHTYLAHRWIWEHEKGQVLGGLCVLHKCDNPPCCNPSHLFLGTKIDNNADMVTKGRTYKPKLSDEDVRTIISSYIPRKVTHRMLAQRYGVSRVTIMGILHGTKRKAAVMNAAQA